MTSIRQIAREIGVHPSTVMRRLAAGCDPRQKRERQKADPSEKPKRKRQPKAQPAFRYVTIDLGEVRQRVAEGRPAASIAAEIGPSTGTIYNLCDRAGIPIRGRRVPNRTHESIDTVIADMRPTEALEYVLEAFKQQTGQDDETLAYAASLGLTQGEGMVFGLLYRNMNHVVPTQRMVDFLDVSQPGNPDRYTLRMVWVYIRKLRVKLAGKYTVQTAHGHGYMMRPA